MGRSVVLTIGDHDTRSSEEKLERVKNLLTDIAALSKGISLTINAGQVLDSRKIKTAAKNLYEKKAAEIRKAEIEKNAASSVGTMVDAQKQHNQGHRQNQFRPGFRGARQGAANQDRYDGKPAATCAFPAGRTKGESRPGLAGRVECPWGACFLPVPVPYAPGHSSCQEKAQQKLMEPSLCPATAASPETCTCRGCFCCRPASQGGIGPGLRRGETAYRRSPYQGTGT